jgi:RsbT co-antagonist protein rsbRD N-terminal domain
VIVTVDDVLVKNRDLIIDQAYAALERAHAAHYEAIGEPLTRQRLTELFDFVVDSIRGRDLSPVVRAAESIAEERFHSGFDISEVQTAFNSLEEAMWRRVVAAEPPNELAECIGLLSTVLGAGKDALARTYVSLASHRHVPSLDLSALFLGETA